MVSAEREGSFDFRLVSRHFQGWLQLLWRLLRGRILGRRLRGVWFVRQFVIALYSRVLLLKVSDLALNDSLFLQLALLNTPLQQNLWVVGGSGRSPSVWNRAIR